MSPADWDPDWDAKGQWELSLWELHRLAVYISAEQKRCTHNDEPITVPRIRNLVNGYLRRLEQAGGAIRPDDDDDQADELPRQCRGPWGWEMEGGSE